MDFSTVNWFAVLACVVVSMVSGSLWYSPRTFFPTWLKGIGKTEGEALGGQNMGVVWGLTVLSSFVQAVAMSFLVTAMGNLTGGSTLAFGALTGFMIWLGFIAPTYLVNKLFAGHGFSVWAIEAGNHLVNFVIFGAIMGAWR